MKSKKNGFATLTVVLIIMLLAAIAVLAAGYQTYQRVKNEQESVMAVAAYNNAQSGLTCARMWLSGKSPDELQTAVSAIPCSEPFVEVSVLKDNASGNFIVNSKGKYTDDNSSIYYLIKNNIIKLLGFLSVPDSAFISKGAVTIGGTVNISGGVNSIVSGGDITISGSAAPSNKPLKPNAGHLKNKLPSDYYLGDGFTSSNTAFKKLTCEEFFTQADPSSYLNTHKNVWLVMTTPECKLPTPISAGNPTGSIDQVNAITLVVENLSGSTTPNLVLGDPPGGTLMMAGMFVFIDKNGLSSKLGLTGSLNISGALVTDSGFSSTTGSLTMVYNEILLNAINKRLSTLGFTRGTWRDY